MLACDRRFLPEVHAAMYAALFQICFVAVGFSLAIAFGAAAAAAAAAHQRKTGHEISGTPTRRPSYFLPFQIHELAIGGIQVLQKGCYN